MPLAKNRLCKGCGKPGLVDSRTYHIECRPFVGRVVEMACIDCGVVRWAHTIKAPKRCRPCENKHRDGANNANWKGGKSSENQRLRRSPEYKAWRIAVFKRDNYTCVECSQVGGKLNADHIKPFALHPELRLDLSNGRTLCEPCHMKTDSFLGGARKLSVRKAKSLRQACINRLNQTNILPVAILAEPNCCSLACMSPTGKFVEFEFCGGLASKPQLRLLKTVSESGGYSFLVSSEEHIEQAIKEIH